MSDFSVFNKRGQVDLTGLDDKIAALDPVRRKALDHLVLVGAENEHAEADLKAAEIAVKEAAKAAANAKRDLEAATPRPTHHDLYLAHVKKRKPAPPTPQAIKAAKAVAAAEEAHAIALDNLDQAREVAKAVRKDFADAVATWSNDGQPLPTRIDTVRQMARSYQPAPQVQRQYLTEIDRTAAATAGPADHRQHGQRFRRGAGGQRSYPQSYRGVKLPSQQ